jgi:Tol biopolymer transport system component
MMVRITGLLALIFLLAGCAGTFTVGLEQTPTPDPAPAATIQALVEENEQLKVNLATAVAPPPPPPSALGRVAYIRGGDLWVTLLPEGPHQRLTIDGHNREPRWSTSGEWIAYRKDRTVLIEREQPCEESLREGQPPCRESVSTFQQQVWLARRNGAEHHVINRGFTVERFAWSPTNDLLAYITEAGHVQTLDPNTGVSLRLVTAQAGGRVSAIAWSPDGLRLAYEWVSDEQVGTNVGREDGVWVVPATGGQAIRLVRSTEFPAALAGWRDSEHTLVWRHPTADVLPTDAVWLFAAPLIRPPATQAPVVVYSQPMLQRADFVAVAPVASPVVAATLGNGLASWTNKRVVAGTFQSPPELAAIMPAWSPDAATLAFVAMPDQPELTLGENALEALLSRHIWVGELLSGTARQLTDDPRYRDERPLWSRQSSHILFARITREGQTSLWLIPAGDGSPGLVVDELTPAPDPIGNYGYIDWSQHYDWWRG